MSRRSTENLVGIVLGIALASLAFKAVSAGFRGMFRLGRSVANNPRTVGKRGERQILETLRSLPKEYVVFSDLLLPWKNETAQIDAVVLGPTGLHVLEVKNWHGFIEGNPDDLTWYLYTSSGRYERHNPLHQNQGHIAAICANLPMLPKKACHGTVVFTKDSVDVPHGFERGELIDQESLQRVIVDLYPKVFDTQAIVDLTAALRELNIKGRAARRSHVRRVKQKYKTEH